MATLKKTENWFSRPIITLNRSKVLQNAPREHSAILLTFIKFCLLLSGRFTQVLLYTITTYFWSRKGIQCSHFKTHVVISQIWIKHGRVVATKFFHHEILRTNYRKWSFCYIVPLWNCPLKCDSLIIRPIPMDLKQSVNKGLHCIYCIFPNYLDKWAWI